MWRAEVADSGAEGVFEGCVAVCQFAADGVCGVEGEPWVGHGVVADEVSGGGDGADDLGALADEAADEEKAGSDLVAGEDFEEAMGGFVVGAVIVGEGDLVRTAWCDEDLPKELDCPAPLPVPPGLDSFRLESQYQLRSSARRE